MRDDEIKALVRDSNPWWRAVAAHTDPVAWVQTHRAFRDRARYDLGYRPDVLADVARDPLNDQLVVLTGPRRIGKSLALLDLARQLCGRPDIDPRQVVHIPCDGMTSKDLNRALVLARRATASVDLSQPARRVWLLDEVSGVQDWTTVLKRNRDQNAFGDDTVIATGSRWVGQDDVTGNLLAGRAGSHDHRRIRHLLPMSFRDYLVARGLDLPRPTPVHPAVLQTPEVSAVLQELELLVDDYDLAWQDYLTSGGFPRAAYEFHTTGQVSKAYLADLQAWLVADMELDDRPDSVPLLLDGLTQRATSPFNVSHAARDLGYPNDKALDRRLVRLVSTFAALPCPHRNDDGVTIPRTQAKLYLVDPVLAWLPTGLRAGLADPQMTTLNEMALGVALAVAIEELQAGRWVAGDTIGYAKTAGGKEIDFAPVSVPTSSGVGRTVPIESKWVTTGWRSEAKSIENRYHAGILATKNILDTSNPTWAVPAPFVALLLR